MPSKKGSKQVDQEPAKPRRSRWRWLRRPIVWIATLLLLVGSIVLAIHLILRSDLPRQWVVQIAEQQTGLRVEIDQLHAHWDGSTELVGLRVGLPLAGDDLLTAPSVTVQHTVPWMLLFTGVGLERIVVEQPRVAVRQDAAGRWNVQELAALLSSDSGDATGGGPMTGLPEIAITDATIHIVDIQQHTATLRGVALRGQPSSGAGWTFRLELDGSGDRTLSGQLVTGGHFTHDLNFTLRDPLALAEPMVGAPLPDIDLRGRWSGSMTNGELKGNLAIDRLAYKDAALTGNLAVSAAPAGIIVRPATMTLDHPSLPDQSAMVDGGNVTFDGAAVSLANMIVRVADGTVRLDGRYELDSGTGKAAMRVADVSYAGAAVEGRADAVLTQPQPGDHQLVVRSRINGSFGQFASRVVSAITLRGSDPKDFAWAAVVEPSSVTQDAMTIPITGAEAHGRLAWPMLTVEASTLKAPVTVQSEGKVNLSTLGWRVAVRSADVPLRNPYDEDAKSGMHTLAFEAEGMGKSVKITGGRFDGPAVNATFDGVYGDSGMQPLRLRLAARAQPLLATTPWGATVRSAISTVSLKIDGALNPMMIAASGELITANVWYADQPLGRMVIPIEGAMLPSGQVRLKSGEVKLFDGAWQINGAAMLSSGDIHATIVAEGVRLQLVDALLPESQRLRGVAALRNFELRMPAADWNQTQIAGDLHVTSLSARGFKLGTLDTKVRLTREAVELNDLKLRLDEGVITGQTRTLLADDMNTEVAVKFADWPLQWPGVDAVALITGDASAGLTTAGLQQAEAATTALLSLEGQSLGSLRVEGRLDEDRIHVTQLSGPILNGEIQGAGELSLTAPLASSGRVTWRDIDLPHTIEVVPQLRLLREYGDIQGSVSGEMTLGPSEDRRAKGAAEIRVAVEPKNASMRGVAFTSANMKVFVQPERIVVDEASLSLAEGSIDGWGRASKHGEEIDIFIHANLDTLDVAPLLAAVSSDAEPMPGKLSGEVTLHVPPKGMDYVDGRADLSIVESDLARLGPLTALYNTMNLDVFGGGEPRGEGTLIARIEQGNLYLSEVRYVNRGTYARAVGVVRDFRKGRDSQVRITAIGSFQPLPRLLFLKDVDNAIRSVQQNLAWVHVTGTLGEPQTAAVSEAGVTRALHSILVGESTENADPE